MPPSISDWQEAEALASLHMRQLGLSRPHLTPPGADGGVDVLADEAAAQVKFEKSTTGKPAVQRLYGEVKRRGIHGIFYSLSGFSAPAITFANETGIALFKFNVDGLVAPVNGHAGHMAAQVRRMAPEARTASRSPWWLAPVAKGRWYFYLPILTWGFLAFVPFIHASVKSRNRRMGWLACLFGAMTFGSCVSLSIISPPADTGPPPEPAMSILMFSLLLGGIIATVLLIRIRREVYHLDGRVPETRRVTLG
ncbi:restriction endonuclease [Stackebrandtia nassauensis]|uniref:Restriction endonuclease type IV Mrr domain-containing protein n=1 Tax=Stackebrandtia nassauensis (strain DSM 44728 / CIP 108903 / NRRL B-16338 / NBRC 102104 / LLR-40K-21) TaxID=446470 RepID=D3QBS2_STANL|nr:restriction endonuclease [Stackebrandtia nassauensis]ADD44811.1 hypothetical protein Snas_5176 [Stackebrandtia nassauensis DSM 44728]